MTTATSITNRAKDGPIVHSDADFQGLIAGEALQKFDLVYLSAANTVSQTTSGTVAAIGIVDRDYASGDKDVSVLKLDGRVLKMTASAAITLGTYVMAAAGGKIATWAATVNTDNVADPKRLGIAMNTVTADGDIVDVITGV